MLRYVTRHVSQQSELKPEIKFMMEKRALQFARGSPF